MEEEIEALQPAVDQLQRFVTWKDIECGRNHKTSTAITERLFERQFNQNLCKKWGGNRI